MPYRNPAANKSPAPVVSITFSQAYDGISSTPSDEIIIDPLEIDESSYHKGFCFKIYSENSKELISGGGYSVNNDVCAGFSGFLENLILESQIKKITKSRILVQHNLKFEKIKLLQKKRKMIVEKSIKKLIFCLCGELTIILFTILET